VSQFAVREAVCPLVDANGRLTPTSLRISVLPGREASRGLPALLDKSHSLEEEPGVSPVQLLEGLEYRYSLEGLSDRKLSSDRPEVVEPDDSTGRTGRIKSALYTGSIPILFFADGVPVGTATVEVRAAKLNYMQQYRWMLRDIASISADLVLERFAVSEQPLSLDSTRSASSTYQQFAFLKSVLEDEMVEAAIHRVLARPYLSWEQEMEDVPPALAGRASSQLNRALSRPGPRHDVTMAREGWSQAIALPRRLPNQRTSDTADNVPNRFVLFALQYWYSELQAMRDRLLAEEESAPRRRGLIEVGTLLLRLEEWTANPLFAGLTPLRELPLTNQVVQRREGYRELLRVFLEGQLAAKLSWNGGDTVYGAGQRNVAALYEYWVYIQLVELCATLCGSTFDPRELVTVEDGGLHIGLARGNARAITGSLTRGGRQIDLELWFNNTFSQSRGSAWTRPMRPDCSLHCTVRPAPRSGRHEVWLHFDAKYRADVLEHLIDRPDESALASDEHGRSSRAGARRDDLLKMHAYRDAIRRTAGAYVIYPGSETEQFLEYHELLPGLGAFALQPDGSGSAKGVVPLRHFVEAVIGHLASQVTARERADYWSTISYTERHQEATGRAVAFLERPPADTDVLLGYVKGPGHWQWVQAHARYNLRVGNRRGAVGLRAREIAVSLVLLYGRDGGPALYRVTGRPELWTKAEMTAEGYPEPRSDYLCLPIFQVEAQLPDVAAIRTYVEKRITPSLFGAPILATWAELSTL
jgi:predicted component of viral defense system (DUF524 family)